MNGSEGDPHCGGFYGEKFDFMGEDGKYYCMLSAGTLQLNVRMHCMPESTFTYIDEVGIKVGNNEVGIVKIKMGLDVDESNYAVAHLDTHQISRDPVYFSSGLKTKFGEAVRGSVHLQTDTLVVEAGNCMISIKRVTEDEELGEIPHLDVHVDVLELGMLSDGVMPHGVIGQTIDKDRKPPKSDTILDRIPEHVYRLNNAEIDVFVERQGAGIVEGSYKDYQVSDAFADDFKFNRFGTAPTHTPTFGRLSTVIAFL
jgi:hypothetical protein